ncbi:hypothetical protein DFO67_12335 [Modicisalibacter xianhensis]|uniref:Uncharacterized protein n=1 Tax=Modicisalibacter xianhensis TaxID=442341 RepID=A0A4R8FNK1_9GAMM|nr:hypothetical protein [Halomonas xianhensis]TDX23831.1 hypothetical protein DFO67_12335 [Halomonas xianhensis]
MRLQYKNTKVLKFFGLNSRVLGEEFSKLNGPSYKTVLRLINGNSTTIRPQTLDLLKRASQRFYTEALPSILSGRKSYEAPPGITEQHQTVFDKLNPWVDYMHEEIICDMIANDCGESAFRAMKESCYSRQVFYNFCLWQGFEYAFFYPHDLGMLNDLSPVRREDKTILPLRRWVEMNLAYSKFLMPEGYIRSYSHLATELGITKQSLSRCMDSRREDYLPRFATLVNWTNGVKEFYGGSAAQPMICSLFVARLLHHFFIDILESTNLTEAQVLEIFSLGKSLRALWPPVLRT